MNNDNNKDQNKNKGKSSHDPSSTTNRGGWGFPFGGYHLPCFKTVDNTSPHECAKEKQYGSFLVNESASHFEN